MKEKVCSASNWTYRSKVGVVYWASPLGLEGILRLEQRPLTAGWMLADMALEPEILRTESKTSNHAVFFFFFSLLHMQSGD